jgi:hypothetical protein
MITTKLIYDNFLSQEAARQRAESLLHHVEAIGGVICARGLEDLLGVSLLHKHFVLKEDEELVGGIQKGYWCSEPTRVSPLALKPMNWKLDQGSNANSSWRAIEYFAPTPELARKAQSADHVIQDSEFWAEVADLVGSHRLQDTFGIALLDHTTSPLNPGLIWFEVSSESARRMVVCQVLPQSTQAFSPGTTVWSFSPNGTDSPSFATAVKACAHGNSRCCCGSNAGARAVLESVGSSAAELFSAGD